MAEAMSPRPLVAGNWKMNGLRAATSEFGKILNGYDEALQAAVDLAICPPATLLMAFAVTARDTHVAVGAQDCHAEPHGAHTGDLSAEMLADAGAVCVIVGHSERRADHGETDATVRAKVEAVRRTGLVAIVCVGETETERNEGRALEIVGRQIEGSLPPGMSAAELIVAYEPVWAIGTGRTPTLDDIAEMHAFIRERLVAMYGEEGGPTRILYGGSVKPSNADEILKVPHVDGALVGGASLKADDFLAIASAYR